MLKSSFDLGQISRLRHHVCPLRHRHTSSAHVRRKFLEYFRSEDHLLLPSSSVRPPASDPSLSFVNAGMNQWKGVFQGSATAPATRVANSQKCVRVGGKHNDLSVVGRDSTHLTMFEMLGSWSFGDYWKREACAKAWHLVTRELGLAPENLLVTYFGGAAGLEADLETREIWRSLGVSDDRLVPLGLADNFWEMGLTGPCGPCTELHYSPGPGGLDTATEIWNLVFMQHDRDIMGQLRPLTTGHVDTGMGLERITAVMGDLWTRDTVTPDLFRTDLMAPLISHISRVTGAREYSSDYSPGNQLDFGYRVLADHSRMLTVCMSDGMLPEDNHKLRNVLRRSQTIARNIFKTEKDLLAELSLKVVDSLGDQFPELRKNHRKVVAVLEFEEENYKRLLDKGTLFMEKIRAEYPDLETSTIDVFDSINYYESLKCLGRELEGLNKNIDGKLAFKLYESHGMDESDIEHLSVITKCSFDTKQFQEYFSEQKLKSKFSTASLQSVDVVNICGSLPETEDSLKYSYSRTEAGDYEFPLVTSSIVGLLSSEDLCPRLEAGQRGAIITAETSFYHEAGGQVGDRGWITASDGGRFMVEDTKRVGGQVLHTGLVTQGLMTCGEAVTLELDAGHRLGCMRHHTATHVLNSVLNTILPVTAQRSSLVTAEYLKFDFSVFKEDVDEKMIETIETRVNDIIESATQISRTIVDVSEMEAVDNLISLAGENYPASVSLISGAGRHTEPCCGTHLLNTRDIKTMVITSLRGLAPGVRSVRAVTGEAAILARQRSQELEDSVSCLEADMRTPLSSGDMKRVLEKISNLETSLSGHDVPYVAGKRLQSILSDMKQSIKTAMRSNTKEAGMEAVRLAIQEQTDSACFCHHLNITGADKFNLTNALKLVSKAKPSLLLVTVGKEMKGKAVVPEGFVKRGLKAKDWMDLVVEEVGGRASAPRGQDQDSNCNLMGGKPLGDSRDKMKHIMRRVTEYARTVIK